jgi:hypothetical protein
MPYGQWVAFEGDGKHDCKNSPGNKRTKGESISRSESFNDINREFIDFEITAEDGKTPALTHTHVSGSQVPTIHRDPLLFNDDVFPQNQKKEQMIPSTSELLSTHEIERREKTPEEIAAAYEMPTDRLYGRGREVESRYAPQRQVPIVHQDRPLFHDGVSPQSGKKEQMIPSTPELPSTNEVEGKCSESGRERRKWSAALLKGIGTIIGCILYIVILGLVMHTCESHLLR